MAPGDSRRGYANARDAVPLVVAALNQQDKAILVSTVQSWIIEGDSQATVRNILGVTAGLSSLAGILVTVLAAELGQEPEAVLQAVAAQMGLHAGED